MDLKMFPKTSDLIGRRIWLRGEHLNGTKRLFFASEMSSVHNKLRSSNTQEYTETEVLRSRLAECR